MNISSKNFLYSIVVIIITYFVLLGIFNYLVDPIGVFSPQKATYLANKRFTSIEKFNNIKKDINGIIVGSSRVGNTYPKLFKKYQKDANFFCFSFPNGCTDDYKKIIQYAIKEAPKIKTVYLMLDEIELRSPAENRGLDKKLHYKITKESVCMFYLQYLFSFFPTTSIETLKMRLSNDIEQGFKNFPDGSYLNYRREAQLQKDPSTYVQKEKSFHKKVDRMQKYMFLNTSVQDVKYIVQLCKKENKKLYITFYPTNAHFLDMYKLDNYYKYLKAVAQIHPYYFFGGYNSISTNDKNYIESSHCSQNIPPIMLEQVFQPSNNRNRNPYKGFGVYIDAQNVDTLIEKLKKDTQNRKIN